MELSEIYVECEGYKWYGWKSVTVKKSLNKVNHSFDMETTDAYGLGIENWNIKGGSEIKIYFGEILVFEGYVQKYDVNISSNSHSIKIAGESRAIDLVQCSHIGKYFWEQGSMEQVVEEVCRPFGFVPLITKNLHSIPEEGFKVAVNNTAYEIIKKIAEKNGLLVFTDNYNHLRLGNDVQQDRYTLLTTGDYTKISASHNIDSQFSKLIIKSQEKSYNSKNKQKFKQQQQKQHIVNNKNLVRYRPKAIVSDGKDLNEKNFADYVNRRLNGNSLSVSATVKAFFDKNNAFWGIGQRLWLREPLINVDQELIIADLTYKIDNSSGASCDMKLQVPETFDIKPPKRVTVRQSKGFMSELLGAFT